MSVVALADFFTPMMAFTPKFTSAATFKAIKVIKYAKKRPKSSQLLKFFSDVIARKSTFGSSAGSDLLAIIGCSLLITESGGKSWTWIDKEVNKE